MAEVAAADDEIVLDVPPPQKRKKEEGDVSRSTQQPKCRREDAASGFALECPVCFLHMRPPFIQCTAGHLVCRDCLVRIKQGNNLCPECRVDLKVTAVNLVARQMAESMSASCNNDGCEFAGAYLDVAEHERACPHGTDAPCPMDDPRLVPWMTGSGNRGYNRWRWRKGGHEHAQFKRASLYEHMKLEHGATRYPDDMQFTWGDAMKITRIARYRKEVYMIVGYLSDDCIYVAAVRLDLGKPRGGSRRTLEAELEDNGTGRSVRRSVPVAELGESRTLWHGNVAVPSFFACFSAEELAEHADEDGKIDLSVSICG